jgi:hypothetical protein
MAGGGVQTPARPNKFTCGVPVIKYVHLWVLVGLLVGLFYGSGYGQARPDTVFVGVVPIDGAPPDSMLVQVIVTPTLDSLLARFSYIQAGRTRWITFFRMQNVYSYPGGIAVSLVETQETLLDHARRVGVSWSDLVGMIKVYFRRR